MSLLSELKAAKGCIADVEEDRTNKHSEDREAVVARQMAFDALKD